MPGKVMAVWAMFDEDQNNFVDFGEFVKAGFLFDVERAKEEIKEQGSAGVFSKYQEDGFMTEEALFKLMEDMHFFVVCTTDVRKLLRMADLNGDNMVDQSEFDIFLEAPTSLNKGAPVEPTGEQYRPSQGRGKSIDFQSINAPAA